MNRSARLLTACCLLACPALSAAQERGRSADTPPELGEVVVVEVAGVDGERVVVEPAMRVIGSRLFLVGLTSPRDSRLPNATTPERPPTLAIAWDRVATMTMYASWKQFKASRNTVAVLAMPREIQAGRWKKRLDDLKADSMKQMVQLAKAQADSDQLARQLGQAKDPKVRKVLTEELRAQQVSREKLNQQLQRLILESKQVRERIEALQRDAEK